MMIRHIYTISIILIATILAVSCTFGTSNIEEGDVMTIDTTKLTSFSNGELMVYKTINVHSGVKEINVNNLKNSLPTLILSSNPIPAGSLDIYSLGNGVYLTSQGASFSFRPADIGLASGGRFSLATIGIKNNINQFVGNSSETEFNTSTLLPVLTDNGTFVFLTTCRLNTNMIPELSDVNISCVPSTEEESNIEPKFTASWSLFEGPNYAPIMLATTESHFDLSALSNKTIYLILAVKMEKRTGNPGIKLVITSGEAPAENPEEIPSVI